ncbi:MAG: ATP-binding protein, partial [Chloroflexota bacterium]
APPRRVVPLPTLPGGIIGRDRELKDLADLLGDPEVRLVSLLGPGGIGKTRLALETGQRLASLFPDGIHFLDLAPMRDPSLVLPAIANALGIDPAGDLLGAIADDLRGRQALLLLDNLEQVTEAGVSIAALLAACAGPKVLVTSRIPLLLRWEWTFPVGPLATPEPHQEHGDGWWGEWDALRLFETRARAVNRAFALADDNAPDVAAICRRIDGLPLAIELAAARTGALPPAAVLARLERRLPLLSGGARDLPERQQTMHNAIAWGFDLLPEEERDCARRVSVFNNGFPLSAACAVHPAGDDTVVIDQVGSLAGKQIIRRSFDGDESDPRFAMLDTIREFAQDDLRLAGYERDAREAHARWILAETAAAAPRFSGPEADDWLDRLALERPNVRDAVDWASGASPAMRDLAVRLCAAFWPVWWRRGHWPEGAALMERALAGRAEGAGASPGDAGDADDAAALHGLGVLLAASGDRAAARERQRQAAALAAAAGDDRTAARALLAGAALADQAGAADDARAARQEALAHARRAEDVHLIAEARAAIER